MASQQPFRSRALRINRAGRHAAAVRRTTFGVETLEHRVLLTAALDMPTLSLGTPQWLPGGDDAGIGAGVSVSGSLPRPNLTAFSPPGWSGAIVTSSVTGTSTDSATILSDDNIYVDWAQVNNGTAATAARYFTKLYVDDQLKATWFNDPPVPAGAAFGVQDFNIGALPAGQHTLRLVSDANGDIAESNEGDNEHIRIISIGQALAITVESPNGNEAWQAGTNHPITWSVAGDASDVSYFNLAYSTDGGATFANITGDAIPASQRSYAWALPGALNSPQMRVRVSAFDAADDVLAVDASDANFAVSPLPPLPVPEFHSRPAAAARLYLDFNGDFTSQWGSHSPGATPAFDRNGDATSFSLSELQAISEIWARVSEKFSPFNLDVTTVNPGALTDQQAYRVVIGGNGSWYGNAGGVAHLGGFYDPAGSNTAWVFSAPSQLSTVKSIAEAVAHEAGHGFGLQHQQTAGAEYYSPTGPRAPVMGASYFADRGLWWRTNEFPGQNSPQPVQDDLLVLSGPLNGFGYRTDDFVSPNPIAGAGSEAAPWQASGVIETLSDADLFLFTVPGGTVDFSLDVAALGPMLDARIELREAISSALIASADPSNSLGATLSDVALAAGSYQLVVRGHGSYGDLGQYTLTGTFAANLPPVVTSLTDSADPVTQGADLTLTALGVSDPDGTVAEVRFYFESNGIIGMQAGPGGDTLLGIDSSGGDGWATTIETDELPAGDYTFYAVATDDLGLSGPAASTGGTIVSPNPPPSATLSVAPAVTSAGGGAYYFQVTYSDDTAVDYRTIVAGNDTIVTGPGGYSALATIVNLPSPADVRVWTATYKIPAPGGSWDAADDGTYLIAMRPNEVSDTAGGFVPAGTLGQFTVSLADTTPPTATLVDAPNVTVPGGTHYFFKVSYADNTSVDYTSIISGGDATVTGPGGFSALTTLANLSVSGGVWTATYYVTAPGGSWNAADDGTYTLTLRAGEVFDTSGNPAAAGTLGAFDVLLSDLTPPTATLVEAPHVAAPGGTHYFFKVRYADNVSVDYTSIIAGGDVLVTGPGSYSATGVLANLTVSGGVWTATYYVTAPGGTWDAADDGTYGIALRANEVSDTSGNQGAALTLGQFTVALSDTTPPTATLVEAPGVTTAGGTYYYFKVSYADNHSVDYQTIIAGSDVLVTGPGNYSAPGALANLTVSGGVWTATYYVTAPGGSWDAADDGTYTLTLRAGEVADVAGNFVVPGPLGTFSVLTAGPVPAALPGTSDTSQFSEVLIVAQRRQTPLAAAVLR